MKLIPLACVATLSFAAAAHAGGLAKPLQMPASAAPAAPIDWTGVYTGISIGEADADIDVMAPIEIDANGMFGGVFAGYQREFGRLVLGVELDLNAANVELDQIDISVDQIHRLKLRAGYDAGPALVYGVAGLAYVKADAAVPGLVNTSVEGVGYVAGAGADFRVSANVIAGVEILYHAFDDFKLSGHNVDASATTIAARIAYRF